ncbi:uridine phosphorylase 1-like [Liolophura sinensis]|uniref:uridine phosphorylase 1-like n=1 Tax=Liolophura sinensis TaxID=3198878 RepID=UPI0031584BCE
METRAIQNGHKFSSDVMPLPNPHLVQMETDILYHIAIATNTHDLPSLFGDVKFVCIGGQPSRMSRFAAMVSRELGDPLPEGQTPQNYAAGTDRYAIYKTGPVLAVSHGIGFASLSVILHEIFKLLYHSRCKDVKIIRVGTSGGLGIKPGTVVITKECVNGMLNNYYEMPVLGKLVRRQAVPDVDFVNDLKRFADKMCCSFPTVTGKTLSVEDFYEGQGRLDGAICDYTQDEKTAFLKRLSGIGVVNIEMESLLLTALCHKAGISCATVCVTLVDRLEEDQLTNSRETMVEWQSRPLTLVTGYIKHKLGL